MTSFSIPPSISQAFETFNLYCPTTFVKITTLGCALPALEMGIRILIDILWVYRTRERYYKIYKSADDEKISEENTRHWKNLNKDLGGAIFFSLCLTNVYTRTIGTVIFAGHSLINYSCQETLKESYAVSKCIAWPVHRFWDSILIPLLECVIYPVLKTLGTILTTVLGKLSLREAPIWYGVAILATGLAGVKGVQVLRARM